MKKKMIALIVSMLLFLILFFAGYLYYMLHSDMEVRTEIRPIDDETYQTLGALEYVDHPEQKNFRNLLFTFKFKYSDGVENIQTELTEPFSQLLTTDVYWSGEGFEYDDTKRKEYTAKQEIVLYMGEISEDELIDLLNEGMFIVTWTEDGKEKRKEFKIGETAIFIQ
ncbi:hypothetical protein [Ureibacillus sp. FSL K6-3587]|uniref:hypothetical protein n=1 Tax=Ureibacillus sp. FSL K6-3587 TaxID=2954681 RepID=UPI003158D3DF